MHPPFVRPLRLALLCLAPFALLGQPAPTGTLTGRVSFRDNGEYLELARVTLEGTGRETLTDSLGSYTFADLPPGPCRVRVFYTGLRGETATVTVAAGQTARHDFSLESAGTRLPATGETVKLAQFVVATSREMDGTAIAINDQRFAPDLRKVIAADEFGTIADGSVGELLKSVPGVSIAWVGGEAMNVQLNGVPADYVPVTVNGFEQASAQANTARNIQMTTMSTNNLSRIEARFSPTPETPGMALAGSVNMVVRSAFDRAKPAFNLSAYLLMRDDARDFHKTPGPARWANRKVHPGFEFSYVKPVSERFGFTLSGGTSTQYQPSTFVQTTWRSAAAATNGGTLPNTTPDQPYLSDYLVRDFPRQTRRTAAGATVDYRLSPASRLSLSVQSAFFAGDYSSRDLTFSVNRLLPGNWGPTFTRGFAGAGSLSMVNADRDQDSATISSSLIYRYSGTVWKAEAGLGDSRSRRIGANLSRHYFGGVNLQRSGVTVAFEDIGYIRPGRIVVTDGVTGASVDPYSLASYAIVSGTGNYQHARKADDDTDDFKRNAYLHLSRDFAGRVPFTLKAGLDLRQNARDRIGGTAVYSFVGADGRASTSPAGTSDDGALPILDELFSRRSGVFGFPATQRPSNGKLWELWQSRPTWFTHNENNLYRSTVGLSKYAEEVTSAAFLRGDVALFDRRLKLVGGLRAEQTNISADGPLEDVTLNYQRDAAGRILLGANGRPLPISTNALEVSQRTYLERANHVEKEYLRLFPSLNASFNLTENLVARAAYYHSVGRPNYNQYAGGVTLPDLEAPPAPNNRIALSNTAIKVWTARSGKLALEYYFEGAGMISVGGYRRQFENFFGSTVLPATPELLAIHGVDFSEYGRYDVATTYNLPATVHMQGLDLQYRQNLTFLPAWARGLQVTASGATQKITGAEADNFSGMIPRTSSLGLALVRPKFNVRFTWTFQSRRKLAQITGLSVGPGTFTYAAPRRLVDLTGEYQLSRRMALFGNIRNLNDTPEDFGRWGPQTPGYARFRQSDRYGALWIFGLRGNF
ncbi:MAG: TonB-dependent receptor [Verrucomicrobia bacterium]|nr:TonB-dependent receptor [Verrucomicrobiota bacterium]